MNTYIIKTYDSITGDVMETLDMNIGICENAKSEFQHILEEKADIDKYAKGKEQSYYALLECVCSNTSEEKECYAPRIEFSIVDEMICVK